MYNDINKAQAYCNKVNAAFGGTNYKVVACGDKFKVVYVK